MKKAISSLLVVAMICSLGVNVFAANVDYTSGTQVIYDGSNNGESYEVTVPALLAPGQSGTVTLTGAWASDTMVKVTSDTSVELTNSINANDKKVLTVSFAGIAEAGSNTTKQTFTETVSVSEINNALFGVWSGHFNYNVETESLKGSIPVTATDSNGRDLNASAYVIEGDEKDDLLSRLEKTELIESADDVDAIIEVESDEFDGLAETTFNVSDIAQTGDKVIILHFNEETQEWEFISEGTVNASGNVTANFSSYSPVAFVVVQSDGTKVTVAICPKCGQQFEESYICWGSIGNPCFDCCGHWYYCDICNENIHSLEGPHTHGVILPPCDECGNPTPDDDLCPDCDCCSDCCMC